MKKIICFALTLLFLFSFCLPCFAVSLNDGKDALNKQFFHGEGPLADGISLDYRYFAPETGEEPLKYPLVVWLHGHANGEKDGYQLQSNSISNWSSAEFQSRFTEGKAYILAARAPEDKGLSWRSELKPALKLAIDDFILKNSEHIDPARIYLGGYSMGGMMTIEMAETYPQMFAAIFPVCPYISPSDYSGENFGNVPVWLTSGKNDHLVNYNSMTKRNWEEIVSCSLKPQDCRFSTLQKVCYPNGKSAPTQHYSWEAVTYDMFSSSDSDYPHMTTVNGKGEEISLTFPKGMIHWLCSFESAYSLNQIDLSQTGSEKPPFNIFDYVGMFFTRIYIFFRNLIRPITG